MLLKRELSPVWHCQDPIPFSCWHRAGVHAAIQRSKIGQGGVFVVVKKRPTVRSAIRRCCCCHCCSAVLLSARSLRTPRCCRYSICTDIAEVPLDKSGRYQYTIAETSAAFTVDVVDCCEEYVLSSTAATLRCLRSFDVPVVKLVPVASVIVILLRRYTKLMRTLFDFNMIRTLLAREDFTFVYDSMHGVAGALGANWAPTCAIVQARSTI